jgi:hypothetical protein
MSSHHRFLGVPADLRPLGAIFSTLSAILSVSYSIVPKHNAVKNTKAAMLVVSSCSIPLVALLNSSRHLQSFASVVYMMD